LCRGWQEEVDKLKELSQDVRSLIEGPFETAMLYVRDASKSDRTAKESEVDWQNARKYLYEAYGQEKVSNRRALIAFHIGSCWLVLGRQNDAREWYEKAFRHVVEEACESGIEVNQRRWGRPRGIADHVITGVLEYWSWSRAKRAMETRLRPTSFVQIHDALRDLSNGPLKPLLVLSDDEKEPLDWILGTLR